MKPEGLSTRDSRKKCLFPGSFQGNLVQVTHFAPWPRLGLAVGMGADTRPEPLGDRGDPVADEVFHLEIGEARGVAQRPAGDGADVLLELVGDTHGLGPVAGIVDAWGDLVDQQRAVREGEEFDTEDADIAECCRNGGGVVTGEL